jgi:hypothetical protein
MYFGAIRATLLPFGIDPSRFALTPLPATPTVLYVGESAIETGADLRSHSHKYRINLVRPNARAGGSGLCLLGGP